MVVNMFSQKVFVYLFEMLGYSQWVFYLVVSKMVGLVFREDINCLRYIVIYFKLVKNYFYCYMLQIRCEIVE